VLYDKHLIANGWQILRIKWRKIDKAFRDELIEKISLFFK
jgi:very-short-patch-repair endonuclease